MSAAGGDLGTHETTFETFGVRVRVRASNGEDLDRISSLLPFGSRPCRVSGLDATFELKKGARARYELRRDGATFKGNLQRDVAMLVLQRELQALVAVDARGFIFIHAGAVAHDGRMVVVPGNSYSGKSMLVSALVRAGAVYYSDEFAVLDEDGLVHPFARPLSLRKNEFEQVDHPVAAIGGVVGEEPLSVGAVVVTSYRAGAEWRPRRLSAGEAALALLAHAIPAQTRPSECLATITRSIHGAIAVEGERGEAELLAHDLLAELRRPANRRA